MSNVYANLIPSKLQVNETYPLEMIHIRSNTSIIPAQPSGEILIELPFDGDVNFPRSEIERLGVQTYINKSEGLQAQIGWIVMNPPINWEDQWERRLAGKNDFLPVQIPLFSNDLLDSDGWVKDQYVAELRHPYDLKKLPFWPIELDFQVSDDVSSFRFDENSGLSPLSPVKTGEMVFDFWITVMLPKRLPRNKVTINLDYLKLEWPTIAPDWQMEIVCQQKKEGGFNQVDWRYNPDEKVIEINNLPVYIDPSYRSDSALSSYRIHVRFYLRKPGNIVINNFLKGSIELSASNLLLSGREISWVNSKGIRIKPERERKFPAIQLKTIFPANFVIDLNDCFQERQIQMYRYWNFQGVCLDDNRKENIVQVLNELGYQRDQRYFNKSDKFIRMKKSTFNKDGKPIDLSVLFLPVEIGKTTTNLERQIPEGLFVKTTVETSDLILHVIGVASAPDEKLSNDLDQLMICLNRRFMAVSDLR
jgi:hypothetical protein